MQNKKRLVLIDGYGLFFRAFFANPKMNRSDGTPTNGAYGFIRMLLNIIIDLNTTHIAIIFDSGKKTFRHEKFPEYKSNRPPVPADMIPQFPMLREVAKIMNIISIEKEGYEADDIIATLAKKAERENFDILIASCDKDLMQLVNDNVKMFDVAKKEVIDRKAVFEKWGVYPEQLLDVLSLVGDTSDNVSGVPTIGEKTATQLIEEFHSIDNLVNNLENVKQKSKREAIKNNLDKLYLSRELITLCDSVELDLTLNDLLFRNFDIQIFKDFLLKMEFFSLIKQFNKYFSGENGGEENTIKNNSSFEYKKITNVNDLKTSIKNIKTNEFCFEFLTDVIGDYNNIISFNFLDKNKKYIYQVNLNNTLETALFDKKIEGLKLEDVIIVLKEVFENNNIKKISYDFKKVFRILLNYNKNIVVNNFDDLSVMSYILDSGKFGQSFSSLLKNYLENNILIRTDNIENNIKIELNYEKGKKINEITTNLFEYSCCKIEYFYLLHEILFSRISAEAELLNLYENIEKPLIRILAKMENVGIKVATQELNHLSLFFNKEMARIEKRIFELSGEEFNISSPKQLAEVLFIKLNIPTKQKSGRNGNLSTSSEILEELYLQGYEIAERVLEYRHFTKLKNTYTDVLPKLIDSKSRVHTNFLNALVITGRLSSNNPNLQNIPIKTFDGEKIRKTFVAENGYSFVGVDYSQIELRILSEYANVKNLIESFNNNIDIHTKTAKEIFKTDKITSEMRQQAKTINFSIVYGTSSFGLAKRLGISNNEAKQYIDEYFKLYPEILDYMENVKNFVREKGYSKTLFGRRCHIDLNVKGAMRGFSERLAINAPIQGTGADIIKKAMIDVDRAIEKYGDGVKIVLQVHDELLIEVKDELVDEVSKIVKEVMENVVSYKVRLSTNCVVGKNWGEVH